MSSTSAPFDKPLPTVAAKRSQSLVLGADTATMLRLTVLTGVLVTGLITVKQLRFPPGDLLGPALIVLALLALAVVYQTVRPAANFVLCLKSLAVLVAFSSVYSVLMYIIATTARPLCDPVLARCDAAIGFSAAPIVRWVNAHATLEWIMRLVYFSLIPQTILAIVCLGLTNRQQPLDKFLVRFILTALICAVGFYCMPAIGTCASFDLGVQRQHQKFVEHFMALRDGSLTVVSWRDAEGLITFPSFHTIWAVLLIAAFSRVRYLFWPMLLLNLAVIASTITTGMHYLTDVVAGAAVAVAVIACTPIKAKGQRREA